MVVMILSMALSLIQSVALTWTPTTSSWPLGANWFPPGPPTAIDAADFLGAGTGSVDLNNGGAGNVANSILFNAATPNYFVENTFNFMPTFSELLTVGTSITQQGANTVQLVNLRLTVPTLNVSSGGFELQGTNIVNITTGANITGGIVCIMAWPPSSISAPAWNVSGGLFKVSGLGVTSPGTASSLIGTVNMSGGTFQAGCSVGTANIIGSLNYGTAATTDFELGTPNIVGSAVNDLINVDGNLTLDGTFNVIPVTGFGVGTYRLINYSGALVNNSAVLGSVPSGYSAQIDLSVTNQVNLVISLNGDCCPPNNAPTVCYTNIIYPGLNYLVNHLCPGSGSQFANYLLDGMTLAHWNATLQDYEVFATYDSGFGGWVDGGFNPISIPTLAVGEEFVLVSPEITTNSFIICGKTPLCPPPCLTNTAGFELVGRLGIGTATWTNLSSCPPTCGTIVKIWNPVTQGFTQYTYGSSGWSPSVPVVPLGHSAFVKIGMDDCNPCTNNLVVNGSFEFPYIGANTVSQQPGILGWSATDGFGNPTTIELWSGSFSSMAAEDGIQHLEINSLAYDVTVSQVITNVSLNCPAHFCFWYTGRPGYPNNSFQVEVIGSGSAPVSFNPPTYTGPSSWLQYCVDFVPTNTTVTIRFKGTSGTALAGAHIDNVSLTQCCTNLPCTNTVTVNCATNKTLPCGTAWNFDAPVITEAGGGTNYTVSFTTTTNGPCPFAQYTRNWTIVDACGNTNYCSQTVTVTNPVPLLSCATNKTVQCGTAWSFDPPTVVNNSCNTTTTVLNTFTNGTCPKNITRMWLVSNPCGASNFCSQTVTIIDTVAPVVTCPTNKTVICGSAWSFDPPTAMDGCSGTNVSLTVLSTVTNGICPKVITRLWKITDQCGNFTTCTQKVTINYSSLVLNCTTNKTVPCGSAWTFNAPTLADASCGSLNVLTTYTNGTDCSKTISRVWFATNNCGAYVTCTQTVSVVDNVAPVLCCPNDMTFTTCSNTYVVNWKVKVTDNCSSGLVATSVPASGTAFPVGTTIVTNTATDACGNVGTCTFKVTVKAGETKTKTLTIGNVDCFAPKPKDSTPRSPALSSLGALGGFDSTPFPGTFGASFLGLPTSISCARLEIRMRPYTGNTNTAFYDKIMLGLTNTSSGGKFAWTNNIGNQGSGGGLIPTSWDFGVPACGRTFYINLSSLIPLMSSSHKLDILVRSNTFVDYARLCYCYCASKPVWKGYEWDILNATLYRACDDIIIVKGTGSGTVTFGSEIGQAAGFTLGFEPIGFASTVDGLKFRPQRVSGASPNQATVSGDGAGGMEFRSTAVRSNVTQLQVTLYNSNTAVSQATIPWSPTALIANTAAGAKLIRATVSENGDKHTFKLEAPVLMGISTNASAVADSIAIKFIGNPDVAGDMVEGYFFDTEVQTEIAMNDARVVLGLAGLGFPMLIECDIAGNALSSVSGDTVTITSMEQSTNSVTGLTLPVSTKPILVQPVLDGCNGWYIDKWIDVKLANIGNVKFTTVSNIWDIGCTFPAINPGNGVRYQVLNAGIVVADSGVTPATSANVSELPSQWSFSTNTAQGIVQMKWAETALFTINGNSVAGDELRLIPLGSNLPTPVLSTVTIESVGIEAITISAPTTGAGPWTLLPLQLSGNSVAIQWNGSTGGILESAPTVLGPWTIVPNQTEFLTIKPKTTAPAEFFRVRSDD